ncbi:MAG: class I SAM-dependent methyltransferase [Planctomycetota bacterium]|nr:class I SAM-dependent methyltransferase [Planctomycetota bacterium]MDP7248280.1 class I SAM-dependent methyltransferase [Planctomycetota bacterium]
MPAVSTSPAHTYSLLITHYASYILADLLAPFALPLPMEDQTLGNELAYLYKLRFSETITYRNEVWKLLCRDFFSEHVPAESTVLDLGCGYGWFINNITCAKKYGMDLNPNTANFLDDDVDFLNQNCSKEWDVPEESLDIVFTSNFFEHLPTKEDLKSTLMRAHQCLKKGGKLIALGPNAKYLAGEYWDFLDHHIAITERALGEALEMCGFQVKKSIPRFLPYSMVSKRPSLFLVKAYLKLPIAWPLFGKQFLVIAEKGVIRNT